MATEAVDAPVVERKPGALALVPAVGVHLGLLALCASAVWTVQPYPRPQPVPHEPHLMALIGAALVVLGVLHGHRRLAWSTGFVPKVALIIGCMAAATVGTDPSLETLAPRLTLPEALAQDIGLGTVAVAAVLVFGLLWFAAGGARGQQRPYVRELVASAIGLVALVLLLQFGLTAAGYGADKGVRSPAQTVYVIGLIVAYAGLGAVASSAAGARGFGRWPLLYVGLALIGHAARVITSAPPA